LELQNSLTAFLERAARMHGQRRAFGSCAWQPTYEELNATANTAAHTLLRHGGQVGDRVAILMDHDSPEVAAVLSVLKAARIVVVLNPSDPLSRLSYVVHNAEAHLILTDEANRKLAEDIAQNDRKVLVFDPRRMDGLTHDPGIAVSPDDVATLTYTSGSTGAPKAVMQTHRQIVPNLVRQSRGLGLVAGDRVALLTLLSGSHGLIILWCALATGCSLWPFSAGEKSIAGLAGWMTDNEISVYISGPSLFRHFIKTLDDSVRFPSVHVVKLTTEPATSEDFTAFQKHFSGQCAFLNILSASEAGSIATLRLFKGDEVAKGILSVGQIEEGVEVLLLDAGGKEVNPGETGEIVIRGHGLAAGYWRNEALTAERFRDDASGNGLRVFRSGDLGRFNAKGLLELCGRKDSRIKIRGHQVEPLEVESVLLGLPGVAKAAVYGIDGGPALGTLLAASIVLEPDGGPSVAAVRRALRDRLPNYMVPSSIVLLDSLPVTPNGKVSREALREKHRCMREGTLSDSPVTPTEVFLTEIWAAAFELPGVGRQEDFFELGGDSLIAAVIAARVSDTLKVDMNLSLFTDYPVLANQAAAIDEFIASGAQRRMPPLLRIQRNGPLPLSYSQERIWRYCQMPEAPAAYHMIATYRFLGPLDAGLLRECMSAMARRHEIVRTTYDLVNGRPMAVIQAPEPVPLPFLDFSGLPDAEEKARQAFKRKVVQPLDLAKGPLVHFSLIKIRDDEYWLLRSSHHILSDGETWNIYFEELALLYEAKLQNRPSHLQEYEPLQYVDYAAWQRHVMRPGMPAYSEALDWWRQRLEGQPPCRDLPFKRSRPLLGIDPAQGTLRYGLDPGSSRALEELRRKVGASFYMSHLAVLAALISDEMGNPNVVLGTYAHNRTRMATRAMLGFFSNPVTLRLHCDPEMTFRNWLVTVRDVVAETSAHAELPYEELLKHFAENRIPPPDLAIIFSADQTNDSQSFANLKLERLKWQERLMPSGFAIHCTERNGQYDCHVIFDAGLYDPAGVRKFMDRFPGFLTSVCRQPDLPLSQSLKMSLSACL
jgi:amino acid adenylation domain-containing protein